MKQTVTNELINERPIVRLIFLLWKQYKGYCEDCYPSVEVYLDMLDVFSRNHIKEYSDGRFFDHLLMNQESTIGWNGEKLKDILHWEVVDLLQKRLTHS